jgi:hypothetical protein
MGKPQKSDEATIQVTEASLIEVAKSVWKSIELLLGNRTGVRAR